MYSDRNKVDLFTINDSTCLTPLAQFASITTAGFGGQSIAFCPQPCNHNILLAVDIAGQGVEIFTINPTGTNCPSTSLGVINPGANYSHSTGFAFTPDGTCFISNDQFINAGVQSSVTNLYTINPFACVLTHAQSLNFGTFITKGLAINPSGTCVAITFPNPLATGHFQINLYTFNSGSVAVNVSPALQVVCPNQSIILTANVSEGTGPFNFIWIGPNGFFQNTGTNPILTIPNPTVLNTGNYTVTVSDALGCQGISSPVEVVVKSILC